VIYRSPSVVKAMKFRRHVSRMGETNKCIPNIGGETSWKMSSWKLEKEMRG
jgi:hypothetical protein